MGFGNGVQHALLARAIPALPVVWAAKGADVLADECIARIHGGERPPNMREAHPAVLVGEAKAYTCDGHPKKGPAHVRRHP